MIASLVAVAITVAVSYSTGIGIVPTFLGLLMTVVYLTLLLAPFVGAALGFIVGLARINEDRE